jgi:hypothetical protein
MSVGIETCCACCDKPVRITLDSDGAWDLERRESAPMVFHPEIDWTTFAKPTIVDDF